MPDEPLADLVQGIKDRAHQLGFDMVGIARAEPSAFAAEYREWIEKGYAGEMDYLARNLERRLDPRELLPNARSIIVVGMNYYTHNTSSPTAQSDEAAAPAKEQPDTQLATFARYALGEDYHDVITARLKELWAFVREHVGAEEQARVYVDAGPVLEREVARRAGLGWFGKNTMLINTRRGSYFFLGEIVTTVDLPPDNPAIGGCGTCTRCLDACPTGAIVEPYRVDARRCLSYLTIELKGAIPEEFRPAIASAGNRIYGCDICQEVCPFNREPETARHPTLTPTLEPAFQPREITSNPRLVDLLMLSEAEFRTQFKGSPVKRAKRRGLLRNVATALYTRDDSEAQDALKQAINDPEELVREAATWSLEQIKERQIRAE